MLVQIQGAPSSQPQRLKQHHLLMFGTFDSIRNRIKKSREPTSLLPLIGTVADQGREQVEVDRGLGEPAGDSSSGQWG